MLRITAAVALVAIVSVAALASTESSQISVDLPTQRGWVSWRPGATPVQLLEKPSTSATVLASLSSGTTIKILRSVSNFKLSRQTWYEVESNARRGFVTAERIDLLQVDAGAGGVDQVALQPNPTESAPLLGFCHPLRGTGVISQGPHGRYSHTGRMEYAFDFATPIGSPIYAMRSGKVVRIRDEFPDTGGGRENISKFNYVLIEHSRGYRSTYLHLKQGFRSLVRVKAGDQVNAGQLIAYSGNSGWSSGPHLHVEVQQPGHSNAFEKTAPFQIDRVCGYKEVGGLTQ